MSDTRQRQKEARFIRHKNDRDYVLYHDMYYYINEHEIYRHIDEYLKDVRDDDLIDFLTFLYRRNYLVTDDEVEIKDVDIYVRNFGKYEDVNYIDKMEWIPRLSKIYKLVIVNITIKSKVNENKKKELIDRYNLNIPMKTLPIYSNMFEDDDLFLFNHSIAILDMSHYVDNDAIDIFDSWPQLRNLSNLYTLDVKELPIFINDLIRRVESYNFDPYDLLGIFDASNPEVYGRLPAILLRESLEMIATVKVSFLEAKKYRYSRDTDVNNDIIEMLSKSISREIKAPVKTVDANREQYRRKIKERKKNRRNKHKYEEPVTIYDEPLLSVPSLTGGELKPIYNNFNMSPFSLPVDYKSPFEDQKPFSLPYDKPNPFDKSTLDITPTPRQGGNPFPSMSTLSDELPKDGIYKFGAN